VKICVERKVLGEAIAVVGRAASGGSAMPILNGVRLAAEGETVEIGATDLDVWHRMRVPARVETAGRVVIDAGLLGKIVARLPEGDVTIETGGVKATVASGRSRYGVEVMAADDFPEWPRLATLATMRLRAEDLRRVLDYVTFAIPKKDPRRVLMGVFFELTPKGLTCVATDGRKLGKVELAPIETGGAAKASAIVGERALKALGQALGEEEEIELGIGERQVTFVVDELEIIAGRIEGDYPKYDAVIPKRFKETLKIYKEALGAEAGRAAVVAERKHHSVILKFAPGVIEVHAQSFGDGEYDGAIEQEYDGKPMRMAFNHQYLKELLGVAPDPVVVMKTAGETAPAVFECESEPGALWLVMPVRLAEAEAASEEEGKEKEEEGKEEEGD
jgi:DNA polymerase-3 subunit beta